MSIANRSWHDIPDALGHYHWPSATCMGTLTEGQEPSTPSYQWFLLVQGQPMWCMFLGPVGSWIPHISWRKPRLPSLPDRLSHHTIHKCTALAMNTMLVIVYHNSRKFTRWPHHHHPCIDTRMRRWQPTTTTPCQYNNEGEQQPDEEEDGHNETMMWQPHHHAALCWHNDNDWCPLPLPWWHDGDNNNKDSKGKGDEDDEGDRHDKAMVTPPLPPPPHVHTTTTTTRGRRPDEEEGDGHGHDETTMWQPHHHPALCQHDDDNVMPMATWWWQWEQGQWWQGWQGGRQWDKEGDRHNATTMQQPHHHPALHRHDGDNDGDEMTTRGMTRGTGLSS